MHKQNVEKVFRALEYPIFIFYGVQTRHSSVNTGIRYGLDDRGSTPGRGKRFFSFP
jgi:hypothetical protein